MASHTCYKLGSQDGPACRHGVAAQDMAERNDINYDGSAAIAMAAGMPCWERHNALRGDMGGAAVITSCMTAVAKLGMNLNLTVLVPLTENMPGSRATRPGDVVTAMNGKTIQVKEFCKREVGTQSRLTGGQH